MANESTKWLYGKLTDLGYNVGETQEEFDSLMNSNAESREWAYKTATEEGFNVGKDIDEFTSLVSGAAGTQPTATQPGWQPSEQQKMQMTFGLQNSVDALGRNIKAGVDQVHRANEAGTLEGQQRLRTAKRQAELAGTQTRVLGTTSGPAAESVVGPEKAGEQDAPTLLPKTRSRKSPVPYGVKYVDGKAVTEWLLPDGRLSTNLLDAEHAESEARVGRLQDKFNERMRRNGLDPTKKEDVEAQARLDAYENESKAQRGIQEQAYGAIADLWSQAEEQYKADKERNANNQWNDYGNMGMMAGREMRMATTSMSKGRDETMRMNRFDLQKIMDETWERTGDKMTEDVYNRLRGQYPDAEEGALRAEASQMARSLSDDAVFRYAVEKNTPKSTLEFFAKTVRDANLATSIGRGINRIAGGSTGDLAAYEAAMGEYGKDHRIAQTLGTITGMVADPALMIGGYFGGAAAKAALSLGGRFVASRAAGTMAAQVGSRVFGGTMAGRLTAGVTAASVNLATYEGIKEAESQFAHGGHVDKRTGEVGGYSAGEMFKSAGHGAIMGALIGPISPVLGNFADKWVKATDRTVRGHAGTMAMQGIRVGEVATSSLLEGTIFAAPDIIEMRGMSDEEFDRYYAEKYHYGHLEGEKRDQARRQARSAEGWDIWDDSMMMMLGLKASHGVKVAPKVIAGLRPIKPTDGKPLTQAELNHNRMDFEERLRKNLKPAEWTTMTRADAYRMAEAMRITKEEREELKAKGYGSLADLFARVQKDADSPTAKAEDGAVDFLRAQAEEIGKTFKFDGYDMMEALIADRTVSQAARAKAYYLLTGRMLQASAVTGHTVEKNEDGTITVNSVDADGDVVTSRRFKSESEAQGEIDNITRQAELNTIDVGEKYANEAISLVAMDEVKGIVGKRRGLPDEAVENIYMKKFRGEKLSGAELDIANEVDAAIERVSEKYRSLSPKAMREAVEARFGVSIDDALGKSDRKRSDAEKQAVKEYARMLFEEAERQRMANAIFNEQYAEMREEEKAVRRQRWRMMMEGRLLEAGDPARTEAEQSYDEGRGVAERFEEGDPGAQADASAIVRRVKEAYQAVGDMFGAGAEERLAWLEEDPWLMVVSDDLHDGQRQAVLEYINAKAAFDGMTDATNEAADRKRAEVEQSVGKRTHKDNGMVIPATMKVNDRQVYIVKGDVVMFPDGTTVDTRNSSESVVVLDAQTGEYEFTSPDQILKVSEAVNPQDELDAALSAIEQEQGAIFAGVQTSEEAGAQTSEEASAQTDEEQVIRGGISGAGEGLRDAFTRERERIGNEWLDNQAVRDALKGYAEGASTIDEIVERAKADSSDQRTKQRLDSLLEFDSTRQKLQTLLRADETAEASQGGEAERPLTALERVPLGHNGKPDFSAVEPGLAWDALVEKTNSEATAQGFADNMVKRAAEEVKKAEKAKLPNTDDIDEYMQADTARRAAIAQAEVRLEHWKSVAGESARRKAEAEAQIAAEKAAEEARIAAEEAAEEARIAAEKAERKALTRINKEYGEVYDRVKNVPEALEILRDNEPHTIEEAASVALSSNKVLWNDDGVRRGTAGETGLGEGERRKLFGQFARRENGGVSLARLAEDTMKEICEVNSIPYDNQDALNALIEVILTSNTRSDIIRYIQRKRMEQALKFAAEYEKYEREQYEAWCQENFHMSSSDYEAYEEMMDDHVRIMLENLDEQEFDSIIADELIQQQSYELRRDRQAEPQREGSGGSPGGEILPGEGLDSPAGTSENARRGGISQGDGGKGSDKARPISKDPQRVAGGAEPTEAQKAAGNYKKEHRRIDGYDITIENAKGSVRRGTSVADDGKETPWETVMQNDYGYIRGTQGVDGDHIDVFLSDAPEQGDVFVIDQLDKDGNFDEHKVMYGFPSVEAAREAYLSNYEPGWAGLGAITQVSKDEFKKWIGSSKRKTKPFAEYKSVKVYKEQNPMLSVEPDGFGDFGPVFTQFKGNAPGAIKLLSELQDGEAIGALHHKDIGDIDLVWGKAGTAKSDGYGLAKLVKYHPEVVEHLQEILDDMHIVKRSENRINLESDTHKAAVRLTWNKEKKKWLLTAFEKKETSESIGKTTDTDDNPSDLRGDTALSQNSDVSDGKVNTLPADKQTKSAESSETERDEFGNPLDDRLDPLVGNAYMDKATGKRMYETKKATTFGEFMLGLHSEFPNDVFTGRDKALAFAKRSDGKSGERYSKDDGPIHTETVVYPISGFDISNMERWTERLGEDTIGIIDDETGAYYEVHYIRPKTIYDRHKVRVIKTTFNAPAPEKQADTTDTYTITPTKYEGKHKTSDVWLVKFNRELTAEEKAAFDTFARGQLTEGKKTSRGWFDHKQGGYMMRSEEAARQLGEMIGNEEGAKSSQDKHGSAGREALRDGAGLEPMAESKAPEVENKAPRVKGGVEMSDEMERKAAELRRLLGADEEQAGTVSEPMPHSSGESRKIHALGVDFACDLIEKGRIQFADFAKSMVEILGDTARPYLKSWYEGVRNMPEYETVAFSNPQDVSRFDVANFDKPGYDPVRDAAMRTEERKAQQLAAKAEAEIEERHSEKAEIREGRTDSQADALIDEFSERYNDFLTESEGLTTEEAELAEETMGQEISRYREELAATLAEEGMSEEDAERVAREAIGHAIAEVQVARYGKERRRQRRNTEMPQGAYSIESAGKASKEGKDSQDYETAGGDVIAFRGYGELPALKPGEVAYVERKFSATREFNFDGSERIESSADVAYLFRELENYSTEHSFAVLVKDGERPIIMQLGMGSESGTVASAIAIRAAYDTYGGADKVYFIHNHPSGTMIPSTQDSSLLGKLQGMLPDGVMQDGVIIDTRSGEYCVFGPTGSSKVRSRAKEGGRETYPVHRFNRHVFLKDYDPSEDMFAKSDEAVARIISSQRLGQRDKQNVLLLSNSLQVVGSFVLPASEDMGELAEETVKLAARFGGRKIVLFGNRPLGERDYMAFVEEVGKRSARELGVLSNVTVENGLNSETAPKAESKADAEPSEEKKEGSAAQSALVGAAKKKEGKIDDFGEKLEGARKDILKEMASGLQDITEAALVAQPLSQVFKRPNTKKLTDNGALTPEEAMVVDSYSLAILGSAKPVVGRSRASKRAGGQTSREQREMEEWAKVQNTRIGELRAYLEADAEGRKAIAEQIQSQLEQKVDVRNSFGSVSNETRLSPVALMLHILKKAGAEPGQKSMPIKVSAHLPDGSSHWRQRVSKSNYVVIGRSTEEALDYLTASYMLKNGLEGVQLPRRLFDVKAKKYERVQSGKYEVMYMQGMSVKTKEFDSLAAAQEFCKRFASEKEYRLKEKTTTGAAIEACIRVTDPLSNEYLELPETYGSIEEARATLDEKAEEINAEAVDLIMKNHEIKRQDKAYFSVQHFPAHGDKKETWAVTATAGRYGEIVSEHGSEAEARAEAAKKEKEVRELEERKKKFDYFKPANERVGENYRNGADATPEMFTEEFGFRGVQFGNWTNQGDRQMALNQAYDALRDLAKAVGLPTRALSLNGELGLAFGARGSGSALAHYEPSTVVINLTKTKGAGSLAHEWWHALDNYFARHSNGKIGYATEGMTGGLRDATAEAFHAIRSAVAASGYAKRSAERGAYWGSMRELTARLFAEWIDKGSGKKGEHSPFLARGVDPQMLDRYKELNWYLYQARASRARRYGQAPKLMSREEFMESPQALRGYVEATAEELRQLGAHIGRLFETLEFEDRDGNVAVYEPEEAYEADDGIIGRKFAEGKPSNKEGGKAMLRPMEEGEPDTEWLESLSDDELVPVFRNVQVLPGMTDLASPMAAKDLATGGCRTIAPRQWNGSYSNVELTEEQQRMYDELAEKGYVVIDGKKRTRFDISPERYFEARATKEPALMFKLDKGVGGIVPASENPYDHGKFNTLNLQFSTGYKRPNLVMVQSVMPKSELRKMMANDEIAEGMYRAPFAKNSTGVVSWTNGDKLALSRWSKIIRVLTNKEVADRINAYWQKNPAKSPAESADARDPFNYTPQVLERLQEMGWKFDEDKLARLASRTPEEIEASYQGMPYVTDEDIARLNAKYADERHASLWDKEPDGFLREAEENTMADKVLQMSERTNTPVRILRTPEEIKAYARNSREANAKGITRINGDRATEIAILLPNNADLADVENTFLHEAMGHDGLRLLFPTKELLDNALDELYNASTDAIKADIDARAKRMYDAEADRIFREKQAAHENVTEANANYYTDMAEAHAEANANREQMKRDATEEYGANVAGKVGEKGFEKMTAEEMTFWGKMKALLQKAFENLLRGLKIPKMRKWTDKQWAYIYHKAYKMKKAKGKMNVFDEAEDVAMRRKTGYDADERAMLRDGDMGLEEAIAKMKADAAQSNSESLQARNEAMRAVTENLQNLVHDMRNRSGKARGFKIADRKVEARVTDAANAQAMYDRATVKRVTDLARILLQHGYLSDITSGEVQRLLAATRDATAMQDISESVDKILDIMIDNQLRMGVNNFGKLLSIRGSKVDARGIEVQGALDPDGQRIAQVVRKAIALPLEDIARRITEVTDNMSSPDKIVADEAVLEYAGLQIARQYAENITGSKAEEKELRDSIKDAEAEYRLGHITKEAFEQYREATIEAIRENKIERAEAYQSLVEQLGGALSESIERAKAWREAEKQRVEEIHHNANSDMEGRPTDEHHKDDRTQKLANNSAVRFLLAPLATFDQMLRMFGKKNARGEGYLWNRFMRGWTTATEKEYTGYRDALKALDAKVSEIYGKKMKWGDLFAIDRKLPKATVKFWDGGEMKDHELTQGNLLYIYMADKMSDGRMKLRRMGITEEDIEDIKNFLDPKFIELADWMQEEFLVGKRNEYNEVHKRMFGASMAAIENYFPLKILANARTEEVDVADDPIDTALPATSTGSIIKRRRNNLALDVTGANAFSVILDHLQQMERWAAFAEFNRDLNTLLSYKRFRNQVMNMSSVYGGGKTLWKNFRNVCSMAAGAYRPPIAALDKAAVNIAKGVTAAKVSFRIFTALKQFLSMPAYVSDCNPVHLAANIANPVAAWKWSMENLPLFEKRWRSRMAGDPRLLKSDMDWKMWRSRVVEMASRIGMSPNAFVDALTVSIGAHSMYQTKLAKYKRLGYDPEAAEERAKQDATILFNQTQQSSESAFLSTIQVDRSWLSVLFTVFRNSSMSYTRQLHDALRNTGRRLKPGYKEESIDFMAKQMERDGLDAEKAMSNARREYRRSALRDLVRVGVFGCALQLAWNLGAYLPYLIFGDDDETKEEFWDDVWTHTMFGSIEGLTGGDAMSAAGNMWLSGEGNPQYLTKDMPLASDVVSILRKVDKDNVSAMNDVINLLVQSGVGVNPQSLTDAAVAVMDYCGDDANTSRECALLIARILNCPQSQIDKLYFDELAATGEETSQMTPAEIAERYARYKTKRNAPLTGWMYGDEQREEVMDKHRGLSNTIAKERLARSTDKKTGQKMPQLLEEYEATDEKLGKIRKLRDKDIDLFYEAFDELVDSPEWERYLLVKGYKHRVDMVTKQWLRATTPEERDSYVRDIVELKNEVVNEVANTQQ